MLSECNLKTNGTNNKPLIVELQGVRPSKLDGGRCVLIMQVSVTFHDSVWRVYPHCSGGRGGECKRIPGTWVPDRVFYSINWFLQHFKAPCWSPIRQEFRPLEEICLQNSIDAIIHSANFEHHAQALSNAKAQNQDHLSLSY